ncbi:DUF6454 family protein [Alteribacillus sp. JSM 102045]|uniref:DUF6454 family protein n=1 Tax=Alteribacillus sp. JSM 102045 TaxID=1562101 RepID=UPI0035C16D9F
MFRLFVVIGSILLWGGISSGFVSSDEHKSDGLSEEVKKLSRSTEWKQVEKIDLDFNIHHPQGMTKIGDLYYISSVEILEETEQYEEPKGGYERSPGEGIGHLFIIDEEGNLVEDLELGEDDMYHPGGIAYDGEYIWVPVSEYRPDSHSIIYKVDPKTKEVTKEFEADDHIGGIVKDEKNNNIYGVNWGSRQLYEWNGKGELKSVQDNNSHFIDYQDCEGVDKGNMLCTGLAELTADTDETYELGGLALLNKKTKEIQHEIPISEFSSNNHNITRNPVFVEKMEKGLRLFGVPDDDYASLYIYETETQ